MASERDSYGSDGYSNGSDSPGAQSGWERAWMRQRDEARWVGCVSGGVGGGSVDIVARLYQVYILIIYAFFRTRACEIDFFRRKSSLQLAYGVGQDAVARARVLHDLIKIINNVYRPLERTLRSTILSHSLFNLTHPYPH